MPVNHLRCFIAMEKSSSSRYKEPSNLSFSALVEFLQTGFFRWVSSTQSFFFRLWFFFTLQRAFEGKNQDLEFLNKQSSITEKKYGNEDDELMMICREDVELVMKSLGLFCNPESDDDKLEESYSFNEVARLFEEEEASLEEFKMAFEVFDENKDGFVDAIELQRVLIILGFNEGSKLENCNKMIRTFDENKDGRIDFHEFVKFMENSFP